MRIWNGLLALVLLLALAAGLTAAWFFLRGVSPADLPLSMWALLAAACLAPAVGLLFWFRAGAASVGASIFLVVAALAGVAGSAVVWLFNLASEF